MPFYAVLSIVAYLCLPNVKCASVTLDDCPSYEHQPGADFDQVKWDAMARCAQNLTEQELVDYVNSHQTLFVAEYLPPQRRSAVMPVESRTDVSSRRRSGSIRDYDETPIPQEFDARKQWPQCADVIGQISDQGGCNDCWAHATTGVMSDRTCIKSNGTQKVALSPYELTACCTECTSNTTCTECFHTKCGKPGDAWEGFKFLNTSGVVTETCQPFSSSLTEPDNPQCAAQCRDEENFETSKHFGQQPYAIGNRTSDNDTTPTDQEAIQREIMAKGPVAVGGFTLFEDFFYYKSGVYVPVKKKEDGAHIARLIGWGEQHGLPYWLVANSWGSARQENGFFRVIRGINTMDIEVYVFAADPKF